MQGLEFGFTMEGYIDVLAFSSLTVRKSSDRLGRSRVMGIYVRSSNLNLGDAPDGGLKNTKLIYIFLSMLFNKICKPSEVLSILTTARAGM
jgi:hypothetical protein